MRSPATDVIEVVFEFGTINPSRALQIMEDIFLNETEKNIVWREKIISLEKLDQLVSRSNRWPGTIMSNRGTFRYTELDSNGVAIIICKSIEKLDDVFEEIIQRQGHMAGLVSARIADENYEFWQNARDISEYEFRGRDHSLLPKKSNRFRPPLDEIIIDTDNNPGLKVFQLGYIETVGRRIYVSKEGALFSKIANASVLTAAGWRVEEGSRSVLIEVADDVFTEGGSFELQNRLRSAVFTDRSPTPPT